MRIAMVSEHASPLAMPGGIDAGGQNLYVDAVARGVAKLGHEVDVFTRRIDRTVPLVVELAERVRVVHLDAGPMAAIPKDDIWPHMPEFRADLLRWMRRGQPYDVLHGNSWMSGWAAVEVGERVGVPVVQMFHALGMTRQHEQGGADSSPAGRFAIERSVVDRATVLLAQCPAERDMLVHDYLADPAKVWMIPSAVDVERFRPVDRDEARMRVGLDVPAGVPVIVYVERIVRREDIRNAVQALAAMADLDPSGPGSSARLVIVGGETTEPDETATPEIGVLRKLAEEFGVADRVEFAGRRQPDELRWWYGAGDIVVTIPLHEPHGLTALEGMACGRTVVGSAVGGISFTVVEGETGRLVPPRDPKALAAMLVDLVRAPDQLARMGRAARERVERLFTWPTVAERTVEAYESAQHIPL